MDFRSNRFTCHYEFPSVYFICYRRTIPNHWSTVIQPLLKQAKVKRNVDSVLRWESIILDPIGPIIALTAFYVFQIFEEGIGFVVIILFILKLLAAILIGFGAAFLFNWLIGQDKIPQSLMPPIQLVFILLTFSICDEILSESGLLAVTIFGLMMARKNVTISSLKNQTTL